MTPSTTLRSRTFVSTLLAATAFGLVATSAHAWDGSADYLTYDGGAQNLSLTDKPSSSISKPIPLPLPPVFGGPSVGATLGVSFQGISQYDVAAFGRNFIPPDTNGAVGTTQFMETTNGAYAVYSKAGVQLSKVSDVAFWAAAGQIGANGDSRVLFDARSQRWIVESFGASISDIQIAISNTADAAAGGWKSVKFTGIAGGIADYPTLAIDGSAVYIGTNDFNGAGTAFLGTTLNVINRNDLFGPGAPNVSSLKQFFTSTASIVAGNDTGFAIQGVNQLNNADKGQILAVGANNYGYASYRVTNPGTAGATETAPVLLSPLAVYDSNAAGRQPYTTGVGNPRVIDTSDDRLASVVSERNGLIYAVHTITPTGSGHTEVEWEIVNAATQTIVATGQIGGNGDGYDYYQGSIAVNASGQVVIGYDRSGTTVGAGKITIFAQTFDPTAGGGLTSTGTFLLQTSVTDSYHNGSTDGNAAAGRQRWGDYAQVTVDPSNFENFWIIGEYAREFNDAANGHPGGSGGSRWSTWISELTLSAVPEPASWAMMLVGFGLVGGAMRRRERTQSI